MSPFATVAQEPFDQTVSRSGNSISRASGAGLQITSTQNLSKIDSYNTVPGQGGQAPLPQGQGSPSLGQQQLPPPQTQGLPTSAGQAGFSYVPSADFASATTNVLSQQQDPSLQFAAQFNTAAFSGAPALDNAGRSGSLKWSQLKGMDSLDFTGSGIDISKLESMELPADLAGEGLMGLLSGPSATSFSGMLPGLQPGDMQRQSSGLESMQSIEHALPNVHGGQQPVAAAVQPVAPNATNYAEVLEAAARDFRASQQRSAQQHNGS
eukprot:CAMPEP_0117651220 /NCGR_PEP_ID=MMETSP0804-20121206/1974_1 /TAXON_ID=1074897 /ORGANISM="Tetraselmis astigmatica, Strain CCMP880" /LENGTH=265 /DNA_ID=CAMNT_0005457179 /DNA_START=528 /DNA_END=1325 /DNA_ORIENTATION=+